MPEGRPAGREISVPARVCPRSVYQPAALPVPVAPDGAGRVHDRRGDRVVVRRPVPVVARAD